MQLFLVRHAIAQDRREADVADEERPLTTKGIHRMREIVRGLSRLGVELGSIWTSPLRRARQTAELLAELRGFDGEIRDEGSLRPGGDFNELARSINASNCEGPLALVGHEPDMGELAAWLVSGRPESFIEMRKGAAACVATDGDVQPGAARLVWLMPPRVMRRLGRAKRD